MTFTARRTDSTLSPRPGLRPRIVTLRAGEVQFVVLSVPLHRAVAMDPLTQAEREVAALAASGLSNQAIARNRGKALRTVANQIASTLRKLGVGSRYELAARLARRSPEDES